MKYKLFLLLILIIATLVRFYNLDTIPSGLYFDEASQGYNAYSILKTGKDEYGMAFPIFLRSFGFYASSLYAYISVIPISMLGLNIFSSRLISALAGILLVLLTYLIVERIDVKNSKVIGLISAFVLALSPWSILFSRGAFEANLALTFFIASIYFFVLSFKNKLFLIVGVILLAVSTYAYQSERLVAQLFLAGFLVIFWKHFNKSQKIVFLSLGLFLIIQLPQLLLLSTKGSSIRFKQLSYFENLLGKDYSPMPLVNKFLGLINIIKEFFSQYLAYFSPRNLFFDPDGQTIRSIPNLSVFYPWMVVPFILGVRNFLKIKADNTIKVILLVLGISAVPAALVGDPFSTLRVLPLLWGLSVVISFGVYGFLVILTKIHLRVVVSIFLVVVSVFHLYVSYFVLLKYERSKDWGYGYKELVQKIQDVKKQVVIEDNSGPAYIEYVFFTKFDPKKLQSLTNPKITEDYYNQIQFEKEIKMANTEFRPTNYSEIEHSDQIIVVDPKAFSRTDAKSHRLELIFEIKDKRGEVLYTGYQTHPKKI